MAAAALLAYDAAAAAASAAAEQLEQKESVVAQRPIPRILHLIARSRRTLLRVQFSAN